MMFSDLAAGIGATPMPASDALLRGLLNRLAGLALAFGLLAGVAGLVMIALSNAGYGQAGLYRLGPKVFVYGVITAIAAFVIFVLAAML